MNPSLKKDYGQQDLFRSRLDQIIVLFRQVGVNFLTWSAPHKERWSPMFGQVSSKVKL